VISKTVRKGTEPVAMTFVAFSGPMKWSPQDRFDLLALGTLGQIWVTDKLREQLGGTYSPALLTGTTFVPRQEYNVIVQYQSSPENVDKLWASVMSIVDSLKTVGPSDADLAKVKEQILRARETNLKVNGYWLANIEGRDKSGEDIAGLLAPYEAMVNRLTAKQIRDAAKKYIDTNRYVKIVLVPEKKAQ
jgi:zinc protease